MKMIRLFVLLSSLATLAAVAEPLRVAIPPSEWFDSPTLPQRYTIPLILDLRDRFEEMPGVSLADEGWTGALLGEFAGGKRISDESSLFAEFAARLPVDAIVRVSATSNALQCVVLTAQGGQKETIPIGGATTVQSVCEAAAAHVAKTLALPPDATRVLTERRLKNPALFETLHLVRRIYVRYPNSVAEARLKLLQPFVGTPDATNLAFAVGIVEGLRSLSNGRASSPLVVGTGTAMAKMSVLRLLGTEFEERAYPILRELTTAFTKDLLDLVKPLSGDALDLTLEETKTPKGGDLFDEAGGNELDLAPSTPGAGPDLGPATLERRLGALRCLGVIQNAKALGTIKLLAKNEDPVQRLAAAEALRHYEGQTGLDLLQTFAEDTDPRVAFAASYGLWKRTQPAKTAGAKKKAKPAAKGQAAPAPAPVLSADEKRESADRVLALARRFGDDKDGARRAAAREVVCALATGEDVAMLRTWSDATAAALRASAVAALVRLGAVEPGRWLALLRDPASAVVVSALDGVPEDAEPAAVARVRMLANDPAAGVAQAASLACAQYRPADPRARLQFDLSVEHPYIRRRLIDGLATNPAPAALEDLAAACTNTEPHTRTHALARLGERDPVRARAALAKALTDPYHWVRLHAAAQLARVATATETDAIRRAQASERDPATRLYLADALALAEGKPAPAPAPAAHSVLGKTNLTWLCGSGEGCETSPFGAYYLLSADRFGEPLQRAHAAGKIVFGRVTPVGNAGTLITDRPVMDGFWLSLQGQLAPDILPHLDGVVYGEETMDAGIGPLWQNGWPLFCFDAGLDPDKVQGIQSNLAPSEARAWNHWAEIQVVEGFNALYDYTKLRFGKLRPGLQVCTFLPGQGALGGPADRRWKFDVAGVYDYKGNNRIAAYTLIRGMKTLWPDRPVLWLSLGIGGYEMNPVRYNQQTPKAPLDWRWDRAYADSVAAWLAGADNGWFSTWIFIAAKDTPSGMAHLKGVQIYPEDIVPGGQTLAKAIEYSFDKVEGIYRYRAEGGAPTIDNADLTDGSESTDVKPLELDEKKPEDDPIYKRVVAEKEQMRIGFHFYGKYVYDCARVFASLPRLNPKPDALAVRPGLSVWSRGNEFALPMHMLLNAYDFLMNVNQVADTDLSRYRLIVLDALNQAPLTDATIAALTGWLRDTPGLLYIHGSLSTNPANEASTAADHDGQLQNRWPWTEAVALINSNNNYSTTGTAVKVMASNFIGPTLVLWQPPEYKGGVLFDTGSRQIDELRSIVNAIAKDRKIGVELTGPANHEIWSEAGIVGAGTAGSPVTNVVSGMDLLTGEVNPSVGSGRSGAIVATNLTGKYVVSMNGLVVLCEKPVQKVEPVPGGVRIQGAGWMQVSAASGAVDVKKADGTSLPSIAPEAFTAWLLFGAEEGIYEPTNKTPTYVRATEPLTIMPKP